jgi:hypothetical protein
MDEEYYNKWSRVAGYPLKFDGDLSWKYFIQKYGGVPNIYWVPGTDYGISCTKYYYFVKYGQIDEKAFNESFDDMRKYVCTELSKMKK